MFLQIPRRLRIGLTVSMSILTAVVMFESFSGLNPVKAVRFMSEMSMDVTTKSTHMLQKAPWLSYKKSSSLQDFDAAATTGQYALEEPVRHVRFLKVHKAGSTTLQNMLFRFALRYNLNILLPKHGNMIMSKHSAVELPKSEHFDIFAIHTVYKKNWFDSILPPDSVNIAIVRHPLDRFISAAFYYRDVQRVGYLRKVPKDNFIHELAQEPDRYDPHEFSQTRNTMGKDFGFPRGLTPGDTTRIDKYLYELNEDFSFVLVMDYFEESLVLLRRLLNWSLLDILYMRTNSHSHNKVVLTPSEITKLKQTCFLDFAIYEFFLKRFRERLQVAGPDFYQEVMHFNRTLEIVASFCTGKTEQMLIIEATKWNRRFNVSREECTMMTKHELSFIDEIRRSHTLKYSHATSRK